MATRSAASRKASVVSRSSRALSEEVGLPIYVDEQYVDYAVAAKQDSGTGPQSKWRRFIRDNILRRFWFEKVIVGLILLNCIALMLEVPGEEDTTLAKVLHGFEYFFTTAFVSEMTLKILGFGFLQYWKDPWNFLDGLIAISGLVSLIISETDEGIPLNSLRAFRVLRPLRAVAGIPEIRIIVNSLLNSVTMLIDVLLLYLFFVVLCGVVAIQFWKGRLKMRCFSIASPAHLLDPLQVCNPSGFQGFQCPWGYECLSWENPNFGKTSFDNLPITSLTIFTAVTLEWWTDTMYYVQDATTVWVAPYFVLLVFLGSFFIVNLSLVIINDAFHRNVEEEKFRKEEEAGRQKEGLHQPPVTPRSMFAAPLTRLTTKVLLKVPQENGVLKYCRTVQDKLLEVVNSQSFSMSVTGIIILNTITLAVEHYPEAPSVAEFLYFANLVFTMVFTVECAVKLAALGFAKFAHDLFNIWDFVIVVMSLVDVLFQTAPGVSVLRTFRLMRVFKLARSFPSLQRWLKIVLASAVEAGWLTSLLMLVIFIFSLLGMQFFAKSFCCLDDDQQGPGEVWDDTVCVYSPDVQCPGVPRENFDRLHWALITVFQILTGEDWNALMYTGMRAIGDHASLYYVACFVIGNYLVLNLFIAVLLNNRALQEEQEALHAEKKDKVPSTSMFVRAKEKALAQLLKVAQRRKYGMPMSPSPSSPRNKHPQTGHMASFMKKVYSAAEPLSPQSGKSRGGASRGSPGAVHDLKTISVDIAGAVGEQSLVQDNNPPVDPGEPDSGPQPIVEPDSKSTAPPGESLMARKLRVLRPQLRMLALRKSHVPETWVDPKTRKTKNTKKLGRTPMTGYEDEMPNGSILVDDVDYSCWIWSSKSKSRQKLTNIVCSSSFQWGVVVLIAVSSVLLAMEDPFRAPDTQMAVWIYNLNIVLTVCFTTECVLKILALGFLIGPNAYLKSWWNALDLLIVVVSVNSILLPRAGQFELLKTLRLLRPVRFINRSEGMRVVVDALLNSIPPLGNVALITFFFWLIFAILGCQLFKGTFYSCVLDSHPDAASFSQYKCESLGGVWTNFYAHFDNVGSACLTLFQVATLEGWVDIMHAGMDGTSPGQAPIVNHSPAMAIYFVMFIILGSFFIVNLCIGVLIDNYYRLRNSLDANYLLTPEQKEWASMQKVMIEYTQKLVTRPVRPDNRWRKWMYDLVSHEYFNFAVTASICMNITIMATEHLGQPEYWADFIDISGDVFGCFYVAEAILKIVAFGWIGYLMNPWNRFDFVINIFFLGQLALPSDVSSFLRTLRLLRLMSVLKVAKGLRTLIRTLVLSLPSLANVAGLLFLLFFLYALLGVKLFGRVVFQENLNYHANFGDVGSAMLVMIRMATGEAWNSLMVDCQVRPPDCNMDIGECGTIWAPIYFCSYMFIGMYVLLNLFIAVILDNFADVQEEEESSITPDSVVAFRRLWLQFDPSRTLYMPVRKVPEFLWQLGPPLGIDHSMSKGEILSDITSLRVLPYQGKVHFQQLLIAISERSFGTELPTATITALERDWDKFMPRLKRKKAFSSESLSAEVLAALKLQAVWRGCKARKRMEETIRSEKEDVLEATNSSSNFRNSFPADGANPIINLMTPNHSMLVARTPTQVPLVHLQPTNEWKQTPHSHHSIPHVYTGTPSHAHVTMMNTYTGPHRFQGATTGVLGSGTRVMSSLPPGVAAERGRPMLGTYPRPTVPTVPPVSTPYYHTTIIQGKPSSTLSSTQRSLEVSSFNVDPIGVRTVAPMSHKNPIASPSHATQVPSPKKRTLRDPRSDSEPKITKIADNPLPSQPREPDIP